jgi:hypothetical protein
LVYCFASKLRCIFTIQPTRHEIKHIRKDLNYYTRKRNDKLVIQFKPVNFAIMSSFMKFMLCSASGVIHRVRLTRGHDLDEEKRLSSSERLKASYVLSQLEYKSIGGLLHLCLTRTRQIQLHTLGTCHCLGDAYTAERHAVREEFGTVLSDGKGSDNNVCSIFL